MLILILLIGAAGGAGYKFVLAKDEPVHAEVPEPEPESDEPLDFVYIDLDPLFVPFQTEDGHRHKIDVVLSLEVGREHQSDKKVRSLMPRLREAYVRSLTSRPYPGTGEGAIKIVYLKNRIRAENNRILGTGTVTLFNEDSVVGLDTIAATLEIAEAGQRSLVLDARSRLRDAMIVELHALVARRKGISIPMDAVKFRLRNVAQRTLGKDVVIDLFVENVLRKDS